MADAGGMMEAKRRMPELRGRLSINYKPRARYPSPGATRAQFNTALQQNSKFWEMLESAKTAK
jgi:hypothetical protein